MKKIMINKKSVSKIKNGYPLIKQEDLVNQEDSQLVGEWVEFVSQQQAYLGTGYLGQQNKGRGWVLSQERGKELDQLFFEAKFSQAISQRENQLTDKLTTAYRLFNGEGDGIGGVTIDCYNEFAVFSWYNASLYHFRSLIIAAFLTTAPFITGVYEKNRFAETDFPQSQHVKGQEAPAPLVVKENGVNYATYLDEGMMTGIFLDQKEVRGQLVAGMAQGLNVLNTFSYTGAFSVAAAMGGASSTVSVDLAKRSLAKTQEMFGLNDISLAQHQIVVMDVFDYIRYAKRNQLKFDMVILDPPSFARNKKRTFSVAQDYEALVAEVSELLVPKGRLIASTNAANLSLDKYQKMVEDGLGKQGRGFRLDSTYRLPADFMLAANFAEGNYLKVLIYNVD